MENTLLNSKSLMVLISIVTISGISLAVVAIMNMQNAHSEIDPHNVSKMTREECLQLPTTSFFFPNVTDNELSAFYNASDIHCKELLKWPPTWINESQFSLSIEKQTN